jgi:hypothetical protein
MERDEHDVHHAADAQGEGGMIAGALVLAASLTQTVTVPAQTVRVHFQTPGNKIEAKLWAKRAGDSEYSLVCAAPCKADIPAGMALRATITDHEDEPNDFVLSNAAGSEVDIIARRGGRGALAGGIVMTSIGGLTALVGVVLTLVSFSDVFGGNNRPQVRTVGLVCIGIGAGLTIGGVSMITGRTYEPFVKQVPYESGRWANVPLPKATQPFSLTLTF